jgi:phosphoglycerate dehydrogenase-like enzyme
MTLRLHIENSRLSSPLAHIDNKHVERALERNPATGRELEVTIGNDGDILDSALLTADLMISSWPPRTGLRDRAPRLRWIQTTSAGVDHLLPFDWLPADIMLTNNSGPHGAKCEEFCLMALVALANRLPSFIDQQRGHLWSSIFTVPIKGKCCVIVGFGDLGQAAGRACKKLDVRVSAITRSGNPEALADAVLPSHRIDEALPEADFVIVTAPLTPATRNIISRERLALLPVTAGLVNVSRSPLVDYSALIEMLNQGRLAGAILDVHEPEPLPPDSDLWATRNLVVTPHVSCDDPRYADMLLDSWFENFTRLLHGQPLRNLVDRVRGY